MVHRKILDPSILGLHVAGDLGPLTIYQTRKGKIVAFPKAPPCKPPSPAQLVQRYRFARSIETWHLLAKSDQALYELVVQKLSLCLTGMNLWMHFCLCPDDGVFATLQQQAGITLYPTPRL